MELSDRIRTVRERAGLSQDALADRLGVSLATVNRYEKGHRVPDADFLSQLVKEMECDAGWLLTGGDVREPETSYGVSPVFAPVKTNGVRELGVYALAGAGPGRDLAQFEPIEMIPVPETFWGVAMLAVQVWGDSMAPLIVEGAYVGVDRQDKRLVSGKIYAVWVPHEGAVIKRVFVAPDRIILKSENPNHPEFAIQAADVSPEMILGRVKWVLQKF